VSANSTPSPTLILPTTTLDEASAGDTDSACSVSANSTPSPTLILPTTTLDDHEAAMLMHPGVLRMLMRQMLTALRQQTLAPLLQHLTVGNIARSQLVIQVAVAGIRGDDFDAVKPYFRALESILRPRDCVWQERVAIAMPLLCESMRDQSNFQKATEAGAERLLKLSKIKGVFDWLQAHRSRWDWLLDWLRVHQYPLSDTGDEAQDWAHQFPGLELFKSARQTISFAGVSYVWHSSYPPFSRLYNNNDRAIHTLRRFSELAAGEPSSARPASGYDSDTDPESLVSKRLSIKWPVGQGYFKGLCDDFDRCTGRHHIKYDDGDQRWYFLSEKCFAVLDDDDLSVLAGAATGNGLENPDRVTAPEAPEPGGAD